MAASTVGNYRDVPFSAPLSAPFSALTSTPVGTPGDTPKFTPLDAGPFTLETRFISCMSYLTFCVSAKGFERAVASHNDGPFCVPAPSAVL